jgi:hypothetical protein
MYCRRPPRLHNAHDTPPLPASRSAPGPHRYFGHAVILADTAPRKRRLVRGYLVEDRKRHPVAQRHGKAFVHRVVLYDTIGPGWHPCHRCGTLLSWDYKFPHPLALTVDHLNRDRMDNRPENLAPCCNRCNPRDGARRMRASQRLPDPVPRPDCVLWTGPVFGKGYGRGPSPLRQLAHRMAWEKERGPIPAGMQVDHVCRVKLCVNVEHMQLLSAGQHATVTLLRERAG